MQKKGNEKGFTLVEVAIVMFIIGILAIAVIVAGVGARETGRINACATTINQLYAAANQYLSRGAMSYTGISVSILQTEELLQGGFQGTGGNPWGGNYTCAANAGNSGKLDITATAVPDKAGSSLENKFRQGGSVDYDTGTDVFTVTF